MATSTQVIQKDVTIIGKLTVTEDVDGKTLTTLRTKTEETTVTLASLIANMAADGVLTPAEKKALLYQWKVIETNKPLILAKAAKQGYAAGDTLVDALTDAYDDLYAYLYTSPGPLADMDANTTIVAATLISTWNAWTTAETDIKDIIADADVGINSDLHGSDDPLPNGDRLFALDDPTCIGVGPRPWIRPSASPVIVPEPKYIGSILNPRVKTNFHGAIGVWKATTNLLTSPEDWTVYTTETMAQNPFNYYVAEVAKTCTVLGFGTSGSEYISKRVAVGSAVTNRQFTFSIRFYSTGTGYIFLAITDTASWSYSIVSRVPVVAGINDMQICVDFGASTSTSIDCVLSRYDFSGNAAAGTRLSSCSGVDGKGGADANPPAIYVLNSQLEESAYATPFTPSTRAAGSLTYANAQPSVLMFEKWVCPGGTYNSGIYMLFRQGSLTADDDLLRIYYDGSTQKWVCGIYNGADHKLKSSNSAIASDAAFRTWQHIRVIFDIPNQSTRFWWNGTEQTAAADSGDVSACAPGSVLEIGYDPYIAGRTFDGLICDLRISETADTSTAHYATGRPYYDPRLWVNEDQSVKIGRGGVVLTNGAEIDLVDNNNRRNRVGHYGMLQYDAAGNLVHDTQNGLITSDQLYLGHVSYKYTGNNILTDTAISGATKHTIDVTADMGQSTNVKGVKLLIGTSLQLAAGAGQTQMTIDIATATKYDDTTSTFPLVNHGVYEVRDASYLKAYAHTTTVECPVFWVSGLAYITIQVAGTVVGSGATLATTIYIVGTMA